MSVYLPPPERAAVVVAIATFRIVAGGGILDGGAGGVEGFGLAATNCGPGRTVEASRFAGFVHRDPRQDAGMIAQLANGRPEQANGARGEVPRPGETQLRSKSWSTSHAHAVADLIEFRVLGMDVNAKSVEAGARGRGHVALVARAIHVGDIDVRPIGGAAQVDGFAVQKEAGLVGGAAATRRCEFRRSPGGGAELSRRRGQLQIGPIERRRAAVPGVPKARRVERSDGVR
jgi:hypothetical protein